MDYSELIAAADASIFTDSISSWIGGISINSVVMLIMMIFMLLGAIDKICGNKLGYGEKFEDGFNAMGGLAMSMAGVVAAAPVLRMLLGPHPHPHLRHLRCQPRYVRHHPAGLRHGRLSSGHPAGR